MKRWQKDALTDKLPGGNNKNLRDFSGEKETLFFDVFYGNSIVHLTQFIVQIWFVVLEFPLQLSRVVAYQHCVMWRLGSLTTINTDQPPKSLSG